MSLILDLAPELEAQLRTEAKKAGLDESQFVLNTLKEHLKLARQTAALSPTETELLQRINLGLLEVSWRRYYDLIAKHRAETLIPDEQRELIKLSDQIEEANARRIEALIRLAQLRGTNLDDLMHDLDLTPPHPQTPTLNPLIRCSGRDHR
jgi:hypothetical protein